MLILTGDITASLMQDSHSLLFHDQCEVLLCKDCYGYWEKTVALVCIEAHVER